MGAFLGAVPLREKAPSFLCADADWGFGAPPAVVGMEGREREGVLTPDGWLLGPAFSGVAASLAFSSDSSAAWSWGGEAAGFDIAT